MMHLTKEQERKFLKFFNQNAFLDMQLESVGKAYEDLTPDEKRSLYKTHTGEQL